MNDGVGDVNGSYYDWCDFDDPSHCVGDVLHYAVRYCDDAVTNRGGPIVANRLCGKSNKRRKMPLQL